MGYYIVIILYTEYIKKSNEPYELVIFGSVE